ncbi:uncharacterized protein LAJ45_04562 [Morchella importuna]|uniref:uncharacterized protein n=1 Tax=Morchella importuna TaxID=1174673 RepID=UPI001E8D5003|nr:uncharacterized protein LAJ45_04562 [Morchella importuna]KAH8151360.1 hypothetical protein LAJ45_04562 [Morchella importuna]
MGLEGNGSPDRLMSLYNALACTCREHGKYLKPISFPKRDQDTDILGHLPWIHFSKTTLVTQQLPKQFTAIEHPRGPGIATCCTPENITGFLGSS